MYNKTGQDRTGQDRTGQDKTRHRLTWPHNECPTKDGKGFQGTGVPFLWREEQLANDVVKESKDGKVVPFQYVPGHG